ncbi:phage regulatory CII family protein [Haloferula sp. BvORR071]|uniref:phage regulatory CII family protein n=1 Tax=Haloferula sp. BvORR071 TaxID=1396141 RepID=UPI000696501E|nr:phage regulatory CII family protein [Haloferula sp. BvORR071]
MESHEVLRRAFSKTSPKAVAADLGISLSLVYKWAEKQSEDGSGSRNPLDRLLKIVELSGDLAVIEWLCQQTGGYFVRNPQSYCEKGYQVLPATNEIIGQFSALLQQISAAALDHTIDTKEARDIRECWDKLKSYAEGFVRCCEEGDYDQMIHIPKPSEGPARYAVKK